MNYEGFVMKIAFTLIGSFIILTSCMSIRYRCGEDFDIEPGPYPGLRITGMLIEQSTHDLETAGMIYGMWFYRVPDIPLSLCLDTLCLPYDLVTISNDDNDENRQEADLPVPRPSNDQAKNIEVNPSFTSKYQSESGNFMQKIDFEILAPPPFSCYFRKSLSDSL